MAGQHVIRAECEWLKRGGMAAEVVPAQIERAAAGENRDAGLRRALAVVAVFVHHPPGTTLFVISASRPAPGKTSANWLMLTGDGHPDGKRRPA